MSKIKINNEKNYMLYPVKTDSFANIRNTLYEWIRFSSHIKPEELLFLNELNNKTIDSLTTEEIEKYLKIKKQKVMSELFIKYKNKSCTKEEHDQVVKYMDNSLESFMEERLTEKEIEYANNILSEFRQMSISELSEFIDNQMINYNNLTILDAYVLYEAKEIRYNKNNMELNEKIRNNQSEREHNLRRSLIRDYGPRR